MVTDTHEPHISPVLPGEDARMVLINNVSWAAVLAGVVVSRVAQLLLTVLGLGIGAATIDPAAREGPEASTLSIRPSRRRRKPPMSPAMRLHAGPVRP